MCIYIYIYTYICIYILIFRIIEDQNNAARVKVSFNLKDIEEFRKCLYDQAVLSSGVQLGLCLLHEIHLPTLIVTERRVIKSLH